MNFEIDVPAYPVKTPIGNHNGITIRQLGTLMVMQGMLAASAEKNIDPKRMAEIAHECAVEALRVST